MDTAVKHPMPDRVKPSFVIFDIRALWRSVTLRTERQSALMSKITNDGLIRSGTGCFIAVSIWQQGNKTAAAASVTGREVDDNFFWRDRNRFNNCAIESGSAYTDNEQ